MARSVGLTIVLMAWLPVAAAGQERLTLEQAVQGTLAQNASLRATRAAVSEADARVAEARSGFYPRLSFTESWQRGDQPVFVFSSLLSARRFAAANFAIDSLNHPDPIGFFRATVGIDQVLFDGGRRRAAAATASLRRDIAVTNTNQAAAGFVLAATQTFGRLLTTQAAREANRAGLAAAREDLARAERRRDVGIVTDADVLALVVHVAELEQRMLQAEGDSAVAAAELNRLMGRPVDHPVDAVDPSMDGDVALEGKDLPALLKEAEGARPEIRRAIALEQLAANGRLLARAALIPQVSAQAAFDVSGTRVNDRASSWLVGGELRWTFSTGGAERAALKAAGEAAARASAETEDARAAAHVEVVSAVRSLATARARHTAGQAAVAQAREAARMIRDRFEAGLASVNDVLRASTAVLDADANRTSALVDTVVNAAMLRRALGRIP